MSARNPYIIIIICRHVIVVFGVHDDGDVLRVAAF